MSAASDGFARQAAIQRSPNSPWILVLQLLRQCRIGKILITHGTQETKNCRRANRREFRICCRWIWPTMMVWLHYLDSRGISIKNQSAALAFKDRN